jgi:DNA-binding transcriptional ArsR family regulator
MTNQNVELKIFAEALLDINRLKIIGELARGNGSVSVLAQRVNMPTDTVISHLEILSKSGVVTLEKQDDSEMTYLLNEAALKEMSKRQLNRARSLQTKEPDFRQIGDQFTADEKKYIRSFTDSNGVIKHLPSLKKTHEAACTSEICHAGPEARHYLQRKRVQ